VHRLGLLQQADHALPNRRVCVSFTSNCVLKQQTCVPESRPGTCTQVTAYLPLAKSFIVAALLHPFTISSTLFCSFFCFHRLTSLLLLFVSQTCTCIVGPFVCSLLTFGHTSEHVVLFIDVLAVVCRLPVLPEFFESVILARARRRPSAATASRARMLLESTA
jgi:hypothetical protein